MNAQQDRFTVDRRDFLRLAGLAGAAVAGLGAVEIGHALTRPAPAGPPGPLGGRDVRQVASMCQMCTTACGIIATVTDGRLTAVRGNPEDPNSQGSVCAKGVAAPSVLYDPQRLLYPMRRVGARGEGRWRRISWDEALTEIADRLREIRRSGRPERFAFQQGRNRSSDATNRFLNAFGTPSAFNHRALCSSNRRAAVLTLIGETDWDLGDYENTDYVLNFGCNWAEAHQGHIPVAIRMMRARERRGARFVTLDSRLSNTAALSDEWLCPKPGTDGAVALAMSQVICTEELWDRAWFDTWSNVPAAAYRDHVARYTPEWAEAESGIPAATIRRVAREFAAAAPRCTTISNRGSQAHRNGYNNDRAIVTLNALVGNMGRPGGWCWHPLGSFDKKRFPEPGPVPPKPTVRSPIADAREYPLANAWTGYSMRVGELVYSWIREGRQEIDALFTYNCDQAWAWPEAGLVRDVLADEELVPFHVCLDVMQSETAHLADIVLPWTTYLERWDIDSRPPQGLVDYVGLRQPVVEPLGESRDLREILPELARRIGDGMERFYPWASTEEYLEEYLAPVPGGLRYMREHGVWQDPSARPRYEPHLRPLTPQELAGTATDPVSGLVTRTGDDGTAEPVGIVVGGVARRGFLTPSRRLEVASGFVVTAGRRAGREISALPVHEPVPDHRRTFAPDEFIMISYKFNVHNAHRTGQSAWLQEIAHTNPAWINSASAAALGLRDGDRIEVVSFRPTDRLVPRGDGSRLGSLVTRVHVTEGVHPRVVAIAHNSGRSRGGPVATNGADTAALPGHGDAAGQPGGIWWAGVLSVSQNDLIPIYPDPATGGQSFNDTVVRIRRLE